MVNARNMGLRDAALLAGRVCVLAACALACALICALSTGCAAAGGAGAGAGPSTTAASDNGKTPAATSEGPAERSATVAVIDSAGREVELPAARTRIVALDSFSAEALAMAGAGDYLLAAPPGVASDTILLQICPALAGLPSPLSAGTVNIESLAELDPDTVLAKASLRISGETAKLDKLGIPYAVVGYSTVEEQIGSLELIGAILPEPQKSRMDTIVEAYRKAVRRVEECAARVPADKQARVYHAINYAVITDGAQSLGADWIARTGAINVSADEAATTDKGDFKTTLEQVFLWDPDVIVCNEAATAEYLRTDRKWAGLRAVKDGNIHVIPTGATRWGQRGSVETWFAMMWLGTTLYPEYFCDIDLHDEVVQFYRDVLGVEVDDTLYAQMLTGKGLRRLPTGENAGR